MSSVGQVNVMFRADAARLAIVLPLCLEFAFGAVPLDANALGGVRWKQLRATACRTNSHCRVR
jgi:hypothetical protein